MDEALRAVAVGAGFLLILAAAEAWVRYGHPPREWSRKLVHFAAGLLVLAFPWIFSSPWTVAALAGMFAALIWATRKLGLLGSVHGVARVSEGGLYYPLAIALLFALAHDEHAFYLVAGLALIVSDSAAALLGSTYGRTTYSVEEDRRSFEGSAAFLLTTFLAAHLPLLLMTEIDRTVCVLLAVHISLVVTLFEGVSLRGSDNLMVPLASYYLLARFASEPAGLIGTHLLVLLAILATLGLLAVRTGLFRASGVMAAGLFFYAVYLLGGPGWVASPALALGGLAVLRYARGRLPSLPDADYQVVATFHAVAVAVALLVANDTLPDLSGVPEWLRDEEAFPGPFAGVIAGELTIVATTQIRPFGPANRRPPSIGVTLGLLAAATAVVAPAGLWLSGGLTTTGVGSAAAVAATAAAIYWTLRALPGWPGSPPWNFRLHTASLGIALLFVLPIHFRILAGG